MPGESEAQHDHANTFAEAAVGAAPSRDRELRVLLVEDSPRDAELVARCLHHGGYQVLYERVRTEAEMRAALERDAFDVVLADPRSTDFGAAAAVAVLRESGQDPPFLVLSAVMDEEAVVAAIKGGADECVAKGDLDRLVPAVERGLRDAAERRRGRRAERARREDALVASALASVARELIGALDTPLLLDGLCRITAEVLGCETSHTLLHEAGEDVFVPIAGYGATAEEREIARVVKLPIAIMGGLLDRLAREDVAEVRNFPRDSSVAPSTHLPAAQLCMALRRGEAVVGIQVACRRERSEPFSEVERRIAGGIGQLASLALDHARVLEELERASRIKAEFVAAVSHELRTPLNVVVGYTDLLIDGAFGELNGEQLDALRRVSTRARGLLELITATLDLSRIEAGRMQLETIEVDVRELLAGLEGEMAEGRPKAEVELRWEIAADVPRLRTDAAKLKVILKNLVTNALKFTERGRVTVRALHQDGAFHFEVTDTGVGIPGEAVPLVFEPFRQLDSSSTRKHGGVGLGLYIVRRLVEMLGGEIRVESRVGEGSRFRVSIREGSPAGAEKGN